MPDVKGVPEDTKARLLDAAAEVFAESGFEDATVREICRRAGANVAAVNYHFGDKLGLYTDVLLRRVRFAQEAASATTGPGTPEQQLRAFLSTYLTGLLGTGKPDTLARLIAAEITRPSPALKKVVNQIVRPTEARLRTLVAEITGLSPDNDEVRMCVHSMIGQCFHYKNAAHVLHILWPDLWRAPDRLQRLTDHILNFSLAGLHSMRDRGKQPQRRQNGGAA